MYTEIEEEVECDSTPMFDRCNGYLLADLHARGPRQIPWWMAEQIIALNTAQEFKEWYDTTQQGYQSLWDSCLTLPESDDEWSKQLSRTAYKFIVAFEAELYSDDSDDMAMYESDDSIPF
mgnify:CR=1 FL=1